MEFLKHNLICYSETLKDFELNNLKYENGKIKLINKNEKGYLVSPIYETKKFLKLTGSFSALTPNKSTIELMIKVFSEGKESKYFSYGKWALKGDNLYYNQDDGFSYMNVDEIVMKDGYKGDKVQFKAILENDCELSLICLSFKLENYQYDISNEIDLNTLPISIEYNVPKLNQNMVPEIGWEMCSATTTTMLLKYKGLDFSKEDSEFEHRYVASLVADRGHNSPTFGNWVFNTQVIGAFGFNAYVARYYSWEELKYHLAKVGPVGASIAGDTGLYKTGGHLICVRGYKEENGKTYVLCNDPNINERFGKGLFVDYAFPLETFMSFWRGVVYAVE